MKNSAPESVPCPAGRFQLMVSGKYKLRILWSLKDGPCRYGEIRKDLLTGSVGSNAVTPRVLTHELKALVRMGMVVRRDHRLVPPKVEYKLTPRGRSFLPVIAVIHRWGMRHLV